MKKISKRSFLIVIIVLLLGFITFQIIRKVTEKAPLSVTQIQKLEGIPVEVTEVRPDTFYKFVNVTGFVGSEEEAYLSSKTGGRILRLYKDVGDSVVKDEKIIEVDTKSMELQKTQAQNQVRIAENSLAQKYAEFEDAKKNLERMQNLLGAGAVSKQEFEKIELEFQIAKQEYESATAQLEVAKDNLEIIETNIKDHSIFAPFDGVVGIRKAEVGEIVGPGQLIISIYNLDKLNAKVEVAENDIPDLKVGQRAIIEIGAVPQDVLEGAVTKISGAPDSSTRLFELHIGFKNTPAGIKPGLFLKGKILVKKKENIITVDSQALLKEGSQYLLFVVEEDKAVKREVEIGDTVGGKVEVLSGIEAGAKVITFGKEIVEEGSPIKIVGGD